MTGLKQAVPTGEHHGRSDLDVDAFRVDLEHHRQFQIEQLNALTADKSSRSDGSPAEVTSALMTAAEAALSDVDAALHRIEEGCFGLCQGCHDPIAVNRLEALPMASLCMSCQNAKEASGHGSEQPPKRSHGLRPVPTRPSPLIPRTPAQRGPQPPNIVDVWGHDSFPASDPPANW